MPCFGQAHRPFAYGDTVAVAIDRKRRHLGVYHSAKGQKVRQLHLAFHDDLQWGEVDQEFSCWIRPQLSEELAFAVSAFCRLFATRYPRGQVPYGFSSPKGALSRTGHLMPGVVGLTCASLVLALFDPSAPLVDYATWHLRPKDVAWQKRLTEDFLAKQLTDEQLEAHLGEIPALRFRPEEVATAAFADTLPQTFEGIQALLQHFRQAASQAEQPHEATGAP